MGYVKLNRNLLRWEWFGNDNALLVLVRLTLKAAWRDTQYQGVALKRGQVITTLQEIVDESQLTKQQVRTALERLEATHKITRTPTKKFSIITLLDYDCFFENNTQNSTQITHEQHTGQHTDNTPSLLKEKSKKKEEEITSEEKEDMTNTNKKIDELVEQRNSILSEYAGGNKLVSQLIDLALLANGMLKGEALSQFIKRSVQMIG